MSGHAFRAVTTLGILISTAACDNVEWGGVQLELLSPPNRQVEQPSAEKGGEVQLPSRAVLFAGTRDSSGVALVPIGEITRDAIVPFPGESETPGYRAAFARALMPTGERFTLFATGARVGTFTVSNVGTDESFCSHRPRATGVAELVPDAAAATRFLALSERFTTELDYAPYASVDHDLAQRAAGIDLAAAMIPQVGATWPESMVSARADIAAFQLERDGPAVSTTFVFRDQARIQRTVPTAYSLYLLAVGRGSQYDAAYAWYREAGREGKGVPVYFDHLDWDGDGQTEVLLEVRGERDRWNAVIERTGGEWERTFEDPCGSAAPPVREG